MDHITFPYRSSSHLLLHHVMAKSGAWEKHGLDVNYDYFISSTDAHADVPTGKVEFVSGNHISTYGHRARADEWVYLGQATNVANLPLVVRKDADAAKVNPMALWDFITYAKSTTTASSRIYTLNRWGQMPKKSAPSCFSGPGGPHDYGSAWSRARRTFRARSALW